MFTDYEKKMLSILEDALKQSLGLCVPTDDIEGLKRRLYVFRKSLKDKGDGRFSGLKLTAHPTDPHELWIVKET